jgi:hypothetical protein
MLTMWHPLSAKAGTNFTKKRRPLGRYGLLADSGHGVCFVVFKCYPGSMNTHEVRVLEDFVT